MGGFTALNVEKEDDYTEEPEDTTEIQLEEAFRLYNNALRLHATGKPDEAATAFVELFKSDIFADPEHYSEFRKDKEDEVVDHLVSQNDSAPLSLIPTGGGDTSASSVPQFLHLSHKGRGQFLLDYTHQKIHAAVSASPEKWKPIIIKVLRDWGPALEFDDTDIDLWKRAARLGAVLPGSRLARFCLESVLAGDDDAGAAIDLSGLDEAYAAGELDELLHDLDDDLSQRLRVGDRPKHSLLKQLKKHNDPLSYLPKQTTASPSTDDQRLPILFKPVRHQTNPSDRSWLSIGQSLLKTLNEEQQGTLDLGPGAAVTISFPPLPDDQGGRPTQQVTTDTPTETQKSVASAGITKENTSDKSTVQSPQDETQHTPQPINGTGIDEQGQQDIHVNGGTEDHDNMEGENKVAQLDGPSSKSVQLPTRKRTSTMAGNDEPSEARARSKRLRARESVLENGAVDEEVVPDLTKYHQDQLQYFVSADALLFSMVTVFLAKIGIDGLNMEAILRQHRAGEDLSERAMDDDVNALGVLLADLRKCLDGWTDDKNAAILQGHGTQDFGGDKTGLTLFLQHSRSNTHNSKDIAEAQSETGLIEFVQEVNDGWLSIHEVSLAWLERLLCSELSSGSASTSSYMRSRWSDEMKQVVVLLVVCEDPHIYATLQARLTSNGTFSRSAGDRRYLELVQTLFELHLDIYSSITNPSSQVDVITKVQQGDRLSRWATLAAEYMQSPPSDDDSSLKLKDLVLRFIWASATHANISEDVPPEHVLLCLKDLQVLISTANEKTILLPNNVAMPEISVSAVQQEISRLSTLDFFLSVFDSSASDPVEVIERLEPILEPETATEPDGAGDLSDASQKQKLVAFLASGDASLKLYLWRRLREAYSSISYPTKVVSCNLRAIETIIQDIKSERHRQGSEAQRQIQVLKWLRDADELVAKLLIKVINDGSSFDVVDEQHLHSSIIAVAELCTLLHGFAIYEDCVRIGQLTPPAIKSAAAQKAFDKSKDRFREMVVRAWTLFYTLLREASVQHQIPSEQAAADLAQYLHCLHHAMGLRHYCRLSNKILLRLMRTELMSQRADSLNNEDVYQVLYDLYGLTFVAGVGTNDHGCSSEVLDKQTATQMVEVVMKQVGRINIRDLAKTELKSTIDRIQHVLGPVKSSLSLQYNKRAITAYLKSPINPKDLYQGVKGVGELATKPVVGDSAVIAGHGWYALLGKITWARFKSTKRIAPTPTDDLDVASTFFRQDLEHNVESWESWYRLAQAYDAKVEDDLLWNITKVTDHKSEFGALQRHAIHAYSMAMITVMRSGDESSETIQTTAEIFHDFALRLYASSREPLAMQAFQLDNVIRHFSSEREGTMYQAPPFRPMSLVSVWSLAAYFLRQPFVGVSKPWTSYYTLGKCLWKMFCSPENARTPHPVSSEEVLEAFIEAIEALPARKSNEYILEPHFKLVSIVHKMVHRKALTPAQGVEYLQATTYARKVHLSEDENGPEWEPYILEVLKKLGHADKSNWHHRIIARSAHVLYDESRTLAGALGAKHEFTQQIFTKTMTMQVWKPEHERAGRHYVYTTRYVSFFVKLLSQLKDRNNLDQLLRRVRRKPTEFLNHQQLWEEITTAYVDLLRRVGNITEAREKAVFDSLNHEDFQKRSEMVEKWAHDPETNSLALDILRDAIEVKKLNNSLMKGSLFDELVSDTYASIYESFVAQLPPDDPAPPQPTGSQPGPPPANNRDSSSASWDPMRVGNMLASQTDGTMDPHRTPTPIGLGLQNAPIVIPGTPPPGSINGTRAPTPVKHGRAKQITRREIIRKAEAAIVKPPPIKTPILSKKPVIEIYMHKPNGTHAAERIDGIKDEVDAMKMGSTNSSRVGSVHDSADDESELSDADEGRRPKPMFPGLVAASRDEDQSSTADGDGADNAGEGEEDHFHDAVEGHAASEVVMVVKPLAD